MSKTDKLSKKKLLDAIVGAKNMASIFQTPGVVACLTQLEEKIEAGEFDYVQPTHLREVGK